MDMVTLALAKKYVADTADSLGSLKGAPCQVQSVVDITDGSGQKGKRITLSWTGTSGTTQTSTVEIYGVTGATGATGAQGEKGDKGDKGDTGAKGADGATGAKGDTGEKGDNGYTPYIDSDTGRWFINGVDTGVRAVGGATSWADIINPPTIPTAVSELSNDKNFIDNTVDNLVNYLKKTDTYTKDEITDLMKNISAGLKTEIVENLPDVSSADSSTIYLIKATDTSYTQYMLISGAFANLGSTEIDLSGYVTTTALENKLQGYSETSHTHTELHTHDNKGVLDGITAEKIANWENHFSGDYNDLTNTPSLSGYATKTDLESKQDTLTNAETVGKLSESDGKLLFDGKTIETDITIDDELSDTSENAVQNKVVKSALDAKQDKIGSITYTEFSALSDEEKEALGKVVVTDCPDYTEKDIYSTEEKVVGQWIDGKPIYQKVLYQQADVTKTIESSMQSVSVATFSDALSNTDNVIRLDGTWGRNNDRNVRKFNLADASFLYRIDVIDGTDIAVTVQRINSEDAVDLIMGKIIIIVEYTKTTD